MGPHKNTLLSFIWRFLNSYTYILLLIIVVILAIAGGCLDPVSGILLKWVVDLLSANEHDIYVLILPASLIVINFLILDNLTIYMTNHIFAKYLPKIQSSIVTETLEHIIAHSCSFYQEVFSGNIANQIIQLSNNIESILTDIPQFIRTFSAVALTLIASYDIHPLLCLLFIIWLMCFLSFSILGSRRIITLSDRLAETESIVTGELVDVLSNHNNIRLFSQKSYEKERMQLFLNNQSNAYTDTNLSGAMLYCIQGASIAIMMILSIIFTLYRYQNGLATPGDFALIITLWLDTSNVVWICVTKLDTFSQAIGTCNQSLEMLMVPVEIVDAPNAAPLICDHGQITFDKVQFAYKDSNPIFKDQSIEIKAKQKIALVGYSGSGKSTFVNLILRLYDTKDGAILIDGQNIKDITQESLRKNISMIQQEPSLFNRSLMDNIRYGNINATDDEVIEASKRAYAHDFIIKLPEGYNSLVGERGVKLSGGERQCIIIARAILKSAPILILDEATNQLDSLTEHLIQKSMKELMDDKTTIIIAHRLSTLAHMHRILVFDKGIIVEDGTHDQILEKAGIYKTLWDAQVGGFFHYSKVT